MFRVPCSVWRVRLFLYLGHDAGLSHRGIPLPPAGFHHRPGAKEEGEGEGVEGEWRGEKVKVSGQRERENHEGRRERGGGTRLVAV